MFFPFFIVAYVYLTVAFTDQRVPVETSCQLNFVVDLLLCVSVLGKLLPCHPVTWWFWTSSWPHGRVLTVDHIIRKHKNSWWTQPAFNCGLKKDFLCPDITSMKANEWLFLFFLIIILLRLNRNTHTSLICGLNDGNGLSVPTDKPTIHVLLSVLLSSIKSVWSLMSVFFYTSLSCWLIDIFRRTALWSICDLPSNNHETRPLNLTGDLQLHVTAPDWWVLKQIP